MKPLPLKQLVRVHGDETNSLHVVIQKKPFPDHFLYGVISVTRYTLRQVVNPEEISWYRIESLTEADPANGEILVDGMPRRDLTVAEMILNNAVETMAKRAADRGQTIERAMPQIVRAFNVITGHNLSERDGNTFMIILKLVRAELSPKHDDYVDGASYMALAGEAAEKEAKDG